MEFDYLYTAESTQSQSNDEQDDAEYWNVSLDAIGRSRYPDDPLWKYDDPRQKMLWMLVKGIPLKTRKSNGGGGNKLECCNKGLSLPDRGTALRWKVR